MAHKNLGLQMNNDEAKPVDGSFDGVYPFIKRSFDIVFSLAVCLIALVPCAILCLITVFESPGNPLYLDGRVGQGGKKINLIKLRTMVPDANDLEKYLNGDQLRQYWQERKIDNDPRVTRIGKFLRKTSLDEIPQFLNVLKGDMSVVGPRPVTEVELAMFGEHRNELLSVPSGITGWWQVTARNEATYENGSRQELELYYVRNASVLLDARIILGTVGVMLGKRKTGR